MKLIENLNWRYATKKFSERRVSQEDLGNIIEATNLSASSAGLQPYRLFVIENQDLKEKLGEGSFNGQIKDSSHLLVFAAFDKMTTEHVDSYIRHIASERNIPEDSLADFKNALHGMVLTRSDEDLAVWAARQAYIALGTALVAAAELRIDATPMEGFDAAKFDELLNLKEKGLTSVVILALGYRHEEDIFSGFKKVRLPKEEFAVTLR